MTAARGDGGGDASFPGLTERAKAYGWFYSGSAFEARREASEREPCSVKSTAELRYELAETRRRYWGAIALTLHDLLRFETGEYVFDGKRCYRVERPYTGFYVPPPQELRILERQYRGALALRERRLLWELRRRRLREALRTVLRLGYEPQPAATQPDRGDGAIS